MGQDTLEEQYLAQPHFGGHVELVVVEWHQLVLEWDWSVECSISLVLLSQDVQLNSAYFRLSVSLSGDRGLVMCMVMHWHLMLPSYVYLH